MNTQRDWLDTFFSRMPPNDMIEILGKAYTKSGGYLNERFLNTIEATFNQHLQTCYETSSKDDREEIVNWGMDQAYRDTHQNGINCKMEGPFKHLRDFGREVLSEVDEKPHCRFESVLRWRMLSHRMDQDTLVCAFLADQDLNRGVNRLLFTWEPVIKTDNIRLHNMLQKGMAENHFHLYGSGPHFQLNWLSLMNRPMGRTAEYKHSEIDKNHLEAMQHFSDSSLKQADTLETLVKKAALIRLYLFEQTNDIKDGLDKNTLYKLLKMSEKQLTIAYAHFAGKISVHRLMRGFLYQGTTTGRPDYALSTALANRNFNHNLFLASERKLLYTCYKRIYENHCNKDAQSDEDLLYIYLLIKSHFRAEFIQVNEKHGFMNFADYQDRKEKFIESEPLYMEALTYMAVASSYKDQNIVSLEARITPKKNAVLLNKTIASIDRVIDNDDQLFKNGLMSNKYSRFVERLKSNEKPLLEENPLFYVIHMPKAKDTKALNKLRKQKTEGEKRALIRPRDTAVRKRNRNTYLQIEKSRYYRTYAAYRIYGIDACSNEVGCRPEAFSHAIRATRYLNSLQTLNTLVTKASKQLPTIRVTYHAGEDYLDPVDGLRAIDEAVMFNHMRHGDRIGHALALGIDVREWYSCKRYTVVLPKQDFIDNLAWMLKKIIDYRIPAENFVIEKLKAEFKKYFDEVYEGNEAVTADQYMRSWTLRGDDPACYKLGKYNAAELHSHWHHYGICNGDAELKNNRNDKSISHLYHLYHFSPSVRINGANRCSIVVSKDYMDVAHAIQKAMQFDLRQKGIAIECNPSSNYLIGSFKRYDKHPIVNFYNLGLTYDHATIEKCPQLFVSINTDDQGVFGTYLENEYALMALALQKCKDADGKLIYNQEMIYDWLDRVRNMGIQQSFRLNAKNL